MTTERRPMRDLPECWFWLSDFEVWEPFTLSTSLENMPAQVFVLAEWHMSSRLDVRPNVPVMMLSSTDQDDHIAVDDRGLADIIRAGRFYWGAGYVLDWASEFPEAAAAMRKVAS